MQCQKINATDCIGACCLVIWQEKPIFAFGEGRLRFGIKKERILFVLRSACTTFADWNITKTRYIDYVITMWYCRVAQCGQINPV